MVLQFNQFMYEMKLKKSGNNFNTFYKPGNTKIFSVSTAKDKDKHLDPR